MVARRQPYLGGGSSAAKDVVDSIGCISGPHGLRSTLHRPLAPEIAKTRLAFSGASKSALETAKLPTLKSGRANVTDTCCKGGASNISVESTVLHQCDGRPADAPASRLSCLSAFAAQLQALSCPADRYAAAQLRFQLCSDHGQP